MNGDGSPTEGGGFDTAGERLRDARRKRRRRKIVGLKKRQLREECGSHVQENFLPTKLRNCK